jgi:hypothetical protein
MNAVLGRARAFDLNSALRMTGLGFERQGPFPHVTLAEAGALIMGMVRVLLLRSRQSA